MMGKNPFEVRLDVVAMAQQMLSENMASKRSKHEAALRNEGISIDAKARNMHLKGIEEATYSANDVITEATALYAFVNTKK